MITRLRVQNFRKHADYTVDFAPGTTIITGPNGSGKTSLIEAIYIALSGKSWRSNFAEIVRSDADWWRVDVEFNNGTKRIVRYKNDVKSFEIDGRKSKILTTKNRRPVVLFEPNDLNLIYGSPSRRREFFDRFISEIEPLHATNLRKFERVLQQRNNLLKQGVGRDELFVWDVQFADLAAKIVDTRQYWLNEIDKLIGKEYERIAKKPDQIYIKYQSENDNSKQTIMNRLATDHNYGFTRSGPQKHDVIFEYNNGIAKTTASRGESRTIIVAMYYCIIKLAKEYRGDPILLFDDIFGEIDDNRRGNISLQGDLQTFITSIDVMRDTKNIHQLSL